MNEIQRISRNTSGEMPGGDSVLIKVDDLANAGEVLTIARDAVTAVLKHRDTDKNSSQWKRLLPSKITTFISQLSFDDYANDELLFPLDAIIDDMQTLKDWEWYSSRELTNGLEIIVQGDFHPRFIWFLHCQNIPLFKISIIKNSVVYPLKVYRDVTSYKKLE